MSTAALDQIQRLIDDLTPVEQARLLEYLAPRIARAVAGSEHHEPTATGDGDDAWTDFFQVGDLLAANDPGEGETLTSSVLTMRR